MAGSGWVLRSTSGHESATWMPDGIVVSRSQRVLTCQVRLEGHYLGGALGGEPAERGDYALDLRGLAVGLRELERVTRFLESWLGLPAGERARHPLQLECTLGSLFDQSLTLSLGDRDDVLSGGNPVAALRYVAGRLTGEMTFVTDARSLGDFSGAMRAWLSDPGREP